MQFLVLLVSLATLAYAQYHHQNGGNNSPAPVHYVNVGPQLQGDYKFGYNTGNGGSFREETRNPDGSVSGAYGYIDGSGQQKVIRYTAGKDGFKAEGDDIPKAPAAPQPAYNSHPQQSHYQPQPAYNHQPQPTYHQPPQQVYHQPQPAYNNYAAPQQHYGGYSQQQQGSYNPFAYINQDPRGQLQPQASQLSQLSYNIGSAGNNPYQG